MSIHSTSAYVSHDLDFVQPGLARRPDAAMVELGFRKEGRHWLHPETAYLVEFPPGPVQVGEETVTEFAEIPTAHGVLRILAPTECVMDRLAGFYHWNDAQCLEQALAVARRHPIDVARIERWSPGEAAAVKFEEFAARLSAPG